MKHLWFRGNAIARYAITRYAITRNALLLVALLLSGVSNTMAQKRVPAEWEPQAATWLQWPGRYEKVYEPAFAKIVSVVSRYQKIHILVASQSVKNSADKALLASGYDSNKDNIQWHRIPSDSAWMRDNGPVYVIEDGKLNIQNWEFDAWGGAFGADIPYGHDNRVPAKLGKVLDLPVVPVDIVHERGNLEFNGVDTVLLNWSTIGDPERNPGYTSEQAIKDLKKHFGVSRVVMVEGIPSGDLTRGHIDGFARFINPKTVVVSQCTAGSKCKPGDDADGSIYDRAAETIGKAGFNVIRDPILTSVRFRDAEFDANYMNWLVGNGFVITVGFGDKKADSAAKKRIEGYFPGREVHVIEMLQSWYNGGGVHCHTNDQPAM